jgi:hypothetical protein
MRSLDDGVASRGDAKQVAGRQVTPRSAELSEKQLVVEKRQRHPVSDARLWHDEQMQTRFTSRSPPQPRDVPWSLQTRAII